jgi:hypothetical protein
VPTAAREDRIVSWAAIEARNVWAEFLRAYYLSGAIRTRTVSGGHVSFTKLSFPNTTAALIYSAQFRRKAFRGHAVRRRDEPAWHVVPDYLSLCRAVGFSNLSQILAAFSYQTEFFEQLTPIRNFYAHRCDETFRKAGQVGIKLGLSSKADLRPTQIMCSKLPGRPQNVITDWLDDIKNVIQLLCT